MYKDRYCKKWFGGVFRYALMSCAVVMASLSSAQAQEEEEASDRLVEEVVVTGSRIKRANLSSSSPVTQVDSKEFLQTGITRVEDLLNDLPQVFNSNNSGDSNGATGTATIDLRGLGSERTLVLLNGRRMQAGGPGGGATAVDVNQIPAVLLERIEVLTGGSSSVYGSDAVAGVVNFITKNDYEGFEINLQHSFYRHSNSSEYQQIVNDSGFTLPSSSVTDGDINAVSVLFGVNSGDGRGNLTGYANIRHIDAVIQGDRDYSACTHNLDRDDGTYYCGGSSTIPNGRFTDFGALDGVGPGSFDYLVEGDQFVPRAGNENALYNYAPSNFYQRPDTRQAFGAMATYEINDKATVYFESQFTDDHTLAQIAPSGAFFVTDSLSCGNPLLSAQQFALLCGDFGLTAADRQTVYLGRRNVEGGFRVNDIRHTAFRNVLGLRGEISDSWEYDAFVNFGESAFSQTYLNDLSSTRIARALDVVDDGSGNAVCASTVDGSDPNCVPWNIFEEGGVTQDALDYLVLPLFATGETNQVQVLGYVSGDTGLSMPTADSTIKLVAGYESREEFLRYSPDNGFISGDGAGQGGPIPAVSGQYDVREIFLEANVPLLENSGIAELLALDLGFRNSSYSNGNSNGTYKVGVEWVFNPTVTARMSVNHAIREPNIRELYFPPAIGLYERSQDPCAGATPTATAAACANTGVTAAQYGTIADSPAGQYNALYGGSPELEPEIADTFTAGVIVSLESGLTLSVDYFNIKVEDFIQEIDPVDTLDNCLLSGDPAFCSLVNRSPTTGTLWIGNDNIVAINTNIAHLETSGFDVNGRYDLNDKVSFNFTATFLSQWDKQNDSLAPVNKCAGLYNNQCLAPKPKTRFNIRSNIELTDDLILSAALRHTSGVSDLDDRYSVNLDAVSYLDVSVLWEIAEGVQFRGGINNLLDEDPPISPDGTNGNTFPGVYDALGQYIFTGITFSY